MEGVPTRNKKSGQFLVVLIPSFKNPLAYVKEWKVPDNMLCLCLVFLLRPTYINIMKDMFEKLNTFY